MQARSIVAAALLALMALPAVAQPASGAVVAKDSQPGKVTLVEAVRIVATVAAIDKASRQVTLKGQEGDSMVLTAGPEVKNFDQIKVGDSVVARYIQSLTLELKKGAAGVRERVESGGVAAAKPGERPAGAAAREVKVTGDVIAVDAKTQTVKVKGPKRTFDLSVKDPEQFKLVKVGDQIEGTYVEAVAVSVEPAPKAAAPKK
jgi:Cu/Ag efflux protein CusF